MRRQLTVILFLAIVLTALASSLVVAVLSYQKMDANARDSISGVHAQLRDRFRTFDLVLAEEEKELDTHLEQVLPKVAAELTTLPGGPRGASAEHLDRLCSRYEVGYIYVINREGIVVNTNFAPDLNLDLAHTGEAMRNLLERLYGSGKVFADRFNASIHTGRRNPPGDGHARHGQLQGHQRQPWSRHRRRSAASRHRHHATGTAGIGPGGTVGG